MSYTSSNPYTTYYTFPNLVSGDLSFTSIVSNEVDYGGFNSFTDNVPDPVANIYTGASGILWDDYKFGVYGPNSSTSITITYDVNDTNPGEAISSLTQFMQVDVDQGPGTSATATEKVYDSSGDLLGTVTWSANDPSPATTLNFASAYQQLQIVLSINESINSTGIVPSLAGPGSQFPKMSP